METKYVAYYRVSTEKQGRSGLGLEAQQETVKSFAKYNKGVIIASYTDIESGKNNNRAELNKAILKARENNAVLLAAKLDRLSRDMEHIFRLRKGVEFLCCDIPDPNTLTLGVTSVVAQHERERISGRIKEAFAAKKARGEQLGNPRWREFLTHEVQVRGAMSNRLKALNNPANKQAAALAIVLRRTGSTLQEIADELNKADFRTPKGCPWLPGSVGRLLNRS